MSVIVVYKMAIFVILKLKIGEENLHCKNC